MSDPRTSVIADALLSPPVTADAVVRGRRFQTAAWRATLPWCGTCNLVVVYFDLPDGTVMALRLDPHSAQSLAETLLDTLSDGRRAKGQCPVCGVQSAKSSGNPHVDVSSPEAKSNV